MREEISVEDVIAYLNELVEVDTPAVGALIANRVPCNQEMADHPTAQVRKQHGGYNVGLLGILNGMFGVDERGWGPIAAVFGEDEDGTSWSRLVGFKRVEHESD